MQLTGYGLPQILSQTHTARRSFTTRRGKPHVPTDFAAIILVTIIGAAALRLGTSPTENSHNLNAIVDLAKSQNAAADSQLSRPLSATPKMQAVHEAVASLNVVGNLGGAILDFAVISPYLYAAIGSRLVVFEEISNGPLVPVFNLSTPDDLPIDLVRVANLLYVIDAHGLRVFDISARRNPRQLGNHHFNDNAYAGAALADGIALLTDRGLVIIDTTNPSSLHEVARLPGVTSPSTGHLALVGHRLYVATWDEGLWGIDLEHKETPRIFSHWPYPQGWKVGDVAVTSQLVLLAARNNGLVVLDLTGASPVQLSARLSPFQAERFYVSGQYAFVSGFGGLAVIDVSDAMDPELVGTIGLPGRNHTLTGDADRHRLYLQGEGRILTVDVQAPARPMLVNTYEAPGVITSLAVNGSTALVGDTNTLFSIDFARLEEPRVIGTRDFPGMVEAIAYQDHMAYVVGLNNGLRILDALDPGRLAEWGATADWSGPFGRAAIQVSGGFAYTTGATEDTLQVVDVRNVRTPQLRGLTSAGHVFDIAVQGDYVYAAGRTGLTIVDVADPSVPSVVSSIATNGGSPAVAVGDGYAYLGSKDGVVVVDITRVEAPTVKGQLPSQQVWDVIVSQGLLLVSHAVREVTVYDLTSPASPTLLGTTSIGYCPAQFMHLTGRRLITSSEFCGLTFAELTLVSVDPTPTPLPTKFQIYLPAVLATGSH